MLSHRWAQTLLSSSRRNSSTYKSSISLSTLYPESSLNIAAPVKIPENDDKTFSGYIPVEKLDISYSRSSGPGGQHVNKVNTKVDIRFHVQSATWLGESVKQNIMENLKDKINKDGFLIARSDKTRSQMLNQADAMMILRQMIRRAIPPKVAQPSEETLHMLRKRMERANINRLAAKREHSRKKDEKRVPFEF